MRRRGLRPFQSIHSDPPREPALSLSPHLSLALDAGAIDRRCRRRAAHPTVSRISGHILPSISIEYSLRRIKGTITRCVIYDLCLGRCLLGCASLCVSAQRSRERDTHISTTPLTHVTHHHPTCTSLLSVHSDLGVMPCACALLGSVYQGIGVRRRTWRLVARAVSPPPSLLPPPSSLPFLDSLIPYLLASCLLSPLACEPERGSGCAGRASAAPPQPGSLGPWPRWPRGPEAS